MILTDDYVMAELENTNFHYIKTEKGLVFIYEGEEYIMCYVNPEIGDTGIVEFITCISNVEDIVFNTYKVVNAVNTALYRCKLIIAGDKVLAKYEVDMLDGFKLEYLILNAFSLLSHARDLFCSKVGIIE